MCGDQNTVRGTEMPETTTGGQSGGVSNTGTINTGGGNVVGGSITITTTTTYYLPTEIHNALQPVADAIRAAPPEKQAEAAAKLEDLKKEVTKGKQANDGTMATLLQQLVGLVPSAVSAVGTAFGMPILSAITGPVTQIVLKALVADQK